MATITILAGLLGVTKESIAQNFADNQKNKDNIENTNGVNNSANILANQDPLAFTQQNIIKYFGTSNKDLINLKENNKTSQELQSYVNFLNEKIWNWSIRSKINELIKQHIIQKISDPKQQIRAIMYALESEVFWSDLSITPFFWNVFVPEEKNYWNFDIVSAFWEAYRIRLETNINQMMKEIEQWKQKLEWNRIEIEKTLQLITPETVKSDPNIKKRIIYRRQRYKDLEQEPKDNHIIELFKALDE